MQREDLYLKEIRIFILLLKKLIDKSISLESMKQEMENQGQDTIILEFINSKSLDSKYIEYLHQYDIQKLKHLLEFQFDKVQNEVSDVDEKQKLIQLFEVYSKKSKNFDFNLNQKIQKWIT